MVKKKWLKVLSGNMNKYFFVIPEQILIDRDVIARTNGKKGSISIPQNLTESHWLLEHRFNYDEPDKTKLLKLFNL